MDQVAIVEIPGSDGTTRQSLDDRWSRVMRVLGPVASDTQRLAKAVTIQSRIEN